MLKVGLTHSWVLILKGGVGEASGDASEIVPFTANRANLTAGNGGNKRRPGVHPKVRLKQGSRHRAGLMPLYYRRAVLNIRPPPVARPWGFPVLVPTPRQCPTTPPRRGGALLCHPDGG